MRERPRVAGIARRLDDRRLAVIEDRLTADLALGRHTVIVPELAQLVSEHPLRERLWELLALARYRSGLQADALQAISDARETLVDALGVEPELGSGAWHRRSSGRTPSSTTSRRSPKLPHRPKAPHPWSLSRSRLPKKSLIPIRPRSRLQHSP